jgi:hypothetical protein
VIHGLLSARVHLPNTAVAAAAVVTSSDQIVARMGHFRYSTCASCCRV